MAIQGTINTNAVQMNLAILRGVKFLMVIVFTVI